MSNSNAEWKPAYPGQRRPRHLRGLPLDAPRGSWVDVKTVKGHQYRYLRWKENGRQRSRYLGRAQDLRGEI